MSTVEYALIVVAVIAIVGIGAAMLSGAFKGLFKDLTTEMGKSVDEVQDQVSAT